MTLQTSGQINLKTDTVRATKRAGAWDIAISLKRKNTYDCISLLSTSDLKDLCRDIDLILAEIKKVDKGKTVSVDNVMYESQFTTCDHHEYVTVEPNRWRAFLRPKLKFCLGCREIEYLRK